MPEARPSSLFARSRLVGFRVGVTFLILVLCGPPLAAEETSIWLGHLTSLPIQAASEQAEALGRLARLVDERLPERRLEPRLFRRYSDATAAFDTEPVDLVLADPAFFLDLPAGEFVPVARLVTEQGSTYRRLLVVRSDSAIETPKALRRQGSLTVVEVTGSRLPEWTSRTAFGGLVDPSSYFTEVRRSPDDFAAVADVLYGESDAALIAEDNPLLIGELGGQLRALHTSEAMSRPILAVRRSAWSDAEFQTLAGVLAAVERDPEGREVLAALSLSGLEMLDRQATMESLLWPPTPFPEPMIAVPTTSVEGVGEPLRPTPEQLEWRISVELPSIPLDPSGDVR